MSDPQSRDIEAERYPNVIERELAAGNTREQAEAFLDCLIKSDLYGQRKRKEEVT
jgi:hypothetical protein